MDLCDRGAGQVNAVPEAEVMLEIQDDALKGADSPFLLEVSLRLVRGLNGKWDIKCSNIKEVGCLDVGPMIDVFRPNAPAEAPPLNPPHVPKIKPKPPMVWQPKRKYLTTRPSPMRETQTSGMSSPCERPFHSLSCPSIASEVSDGL